MRVFVAGATGFLGRHVVDRLLADGHEVVGLARHEAAFSRFGGRVAVVNGDLTKPHTFRGRLLHCDASVNLVGILRQHRSRGITYSRVVVNGTKSWIRECKEAGVKHVVYVSAIGANPDGTPYQRSKWAAEQAVRNGEVPWTIVRPSLVSGEEGFAPQLASTMSLKLTPVWGRPDYFFQPVDVEDVAQVVGRSLRTPRARGQVYSLGGPDQFTYRELLSEIAKAYRKHPWFMPAPWFGAYVVGATLGWLPFFPATLENFRLLRQGNVAPDDRWLAEFDIRPTPFPESLRKGLGRASP